MWILILIIYVLGALATPLTHYWIRCEEFKQLKQSGWTGEFDQWYNITDEIGLCCILAFFWPIVIFLMLAWKLLDLCRLHIRKTVGIRLNKNQE